MGGGEVAPSPGFPGGPNGPLVNLWTIFENVLTELTSNTFFAILLVSSLVYIAFRLIKKAKRASR